MHLVDAVLRGGDDGKARRTYWPDDVYVTWDSVHRLGGYPIVMNDAGSPQSEPRCVSVYLTLRCLDPWRRTLARRDYGNGLVRPEQDVFRFVVNGWQPSIDDLLAGDWTLL